MFKDKFVFYIKHLCGENKKETFNIKLKISGENISLSRSMRGKFAQFGMGVVCLEHTSLDICSNVMKEILALNQIIK